MMEGFQAASPTDRVLASLHNNQLKLPTTFYKAMNEERQMVANGYIVAYHSIPDTHINDALTLYEFYAEMFSIATLHEVSLPLLPRLIQKHFEPPWNSTDKMRKLFRHDHDENWTRVGISCSASLASNTEAPPWKCFKKGYSGSTASKPNAKSLIYEVLKQYKCAEATATRLAEAVALKGNELFKSVGGSLLQIFIHRDYAKNFVYLTRQWDEFLQTGDEMIATLDKCNLDTMQLRIIAHPDLFRDKRVADIRHYPYNPLAYKQSHQQFRTFIRYQIASVQISTMKEVLFSFYSRRCQCGCFALIANDCVNA
jgi:hypothetical protein